MEKEKYVRAELELIRFLTEDILLTSGEEDDEYLGPGVH